MHGEFRMARQVGWTAAARLPEATVRQGGGPGWSHAGLCGRLAELSAPQAAASLTLAFSLLLDAQRAGETAAWIAVGRNLFFPPDAAETGVDLEALPVVRLQDPLAACHAAETLLRSGAFGLLVLDLGACAPLPLPVQARLVKLAQRHAAAVLCLTRKRAGEGSLGPLVSLRVESVRQRLGEERFACELRVLKDKRHGPRWGHSEPCRGPAGLR
jgi:recombination protein RecA